MTPNQFIAKWKAAELKERSAAQSHFNDLCRMLDEPGPTDADPKGEWYAFERGATKTTGGEGWADVWKRGHFGWEYKGKRKDLNAAFAQLQQYALALENPPLLVVCDLDRFRIRTNWTNSVSEVHEFTLDDLRDPNVRQKLKWVLSDPEKLKPGKTRQDLTEDAAAEFAKLAHRLRARGHDAEVVAHFVNRLIFCMFAEDVDLLPKKLFSRMLATATTKPEHFQARASELFRAMKAGGEAAWEPIAWFNGGLFDDDLALPFDSDDVALTIRAAELDWAEIDPSILGTLFERLVLEEKADFRSQTGAHYTDRDKIMLIIEPVIVRPWLAAWGETKAEIARHMNAVADARARRPTTQSEARKVHAAARRAEEAASRAARKAFSGFIERLSAFRVLDPACGSGNFLYLALIALKDIEHRANIEAEAMGLDRVAPIIGPASVKGIEINPYAAELARVSVWIGEIQWMRRNGFDVSRDPILKPLDTIECRDAILNHDGAAATWPHADVVIGNPPFLGSKEMRGRLPANYLAALRKAYGGEIAGQCDLVMYWFHRAGKLLESGLIKATGFVATNKIRKGANHNLLETICNTTRISCAWSDLRWVVDGAAVRVSVVCLDSKAKAHLGNEIYLNGSLVHSISPELVRADSASFDRAFVLAENKGVAFVGGQKDGPFDIPFETAAAMLRAPLNPNGRGNADVVRPWCNGMDLARRPSNTWIIDFGEQSLTAAQLYEAPFAYVEENVLPHRAKNNDKHRKAFWWQHGRPASRAKSATHGAEWMIATPLTSKHRWFVKIPSRYFPDNSVVVITRDDYTTFGIVSSSYHVLWASRRGNFLGVGNDPRYTSSTTFETFPFPEGLTPNIPASAYAADPRAVKIADAAKRLIDLREAWLNPSDLVKRVPEVVPGFPDRIIPIDDRAALILKKRTLTNLYNERPRWLASAHRDLDATVAAAYGWPAEISEDDALLRLFELNQARFRTP